MIGEIIKTWQDNKDSIDKGLVHTCQYCKKEFKRESTLVAHQCELKRRWHQEKEMGVQFGLHAYLRFYEITQGSARFKNYSDFVQSSFYTAFVKFGRHIIAIRAVEPKSFIEYVIRQNKKIDHWCHDTVYIEYLSQHIRKEPVQDALERGLLEMQKYVDANPNLKNGLKEYFMYGNTNKICYDIANGRVSPWIVYNCDTGIRFLENLSEEQISIIISWIDPDYWQRKFKDYPADSEWIKMILKQAGL